MFFTVIGSFSIAIGMMIVLIDFFSKDEITHLYDNGLVLEVGEKRYEYPWAEIKKVHIQEFFESRTAPQKFCLCVKGTKLRGFYFTSHYQGNPDAIINMIKGRVEEVTFKKFDPS